MEGHKYSGYLADDESFRRPQDSNAHTSPRRGPCDWRTMLRPPSRCQYRSQEPATSTRPLHGFSQGDQGKRKRHQSSSSSSSNNNPNERTSDLANEFSEFVDFLADEDVLESLQQIVEDAVKKLRDVTSQSGEPIFDLQEESASSVESETWSYSYTSTRSQIQYQTTTTATTTVSSSDDDQDKHFLSPQSSKAGRQICLLDKYVSRLPKVGKQAAQELSRRIHAESFSEQSGESYFQQQYLQIWAKSFEHPRREFFAKLQRALPQDSLSFESLHKEITSVLKRPIRHGLPLHYICHKHLHILEFLEETKILAGLQDVINQAVLKIVEATVTRGIVDLFDEGGYSTSWDSEEESISESYESEEETTEEAKLYVICKKKEETLSEEEKGKHTPPALPKSKQKPATPEESARKAKSGPPSKTKETPTKPRYVPPPLPKSKQKKQEPSQAETETTKSTRHMITPKDIKRARLQGKPLPKQSIIDFLIENAAKLILYKYNYETLLSEKLGFISVPVTKVLLEIMFGYKKIKGSGIRLSSQIDWTKVYDEVSKKRPAKPKVSKQDKKKKGEEKKEKKAGKKKKIEDKKSLFSKSLDMPKGKVVAVKLHGDPDTKKEGVSEEGEPQIFEIVPPQFPSDAEQASADETGGTQLGSSKRSPSSTKVSTIPTDNPKKPGAQDLEKSPSALGTPRSSWSIQRATPAVLFPEVDATSQGSESQAKKSLTPKSSFAGDGSKTVLPKI